MNIDELTLGQIKEISQMTGCTTNAPKSPFIGKRVLIRTYSAGVHIGILKAKDGENVLLEKSHRLWKWGGAFTLSEVATKGVNNDSRVACEVELLELTNAIEIIPVSDEAWKTVNKNVE